MPPNTPGPGPAAHSTYRHYQPTTFGLFLNSEKKPSITTNLIIIYLGKIIIKDKPGD